MQTDLCLRKDEERLERGGTVFPLEIPELSEDSGRARVLLGTDLGDCLGSHTGTSIYYQCKLE